MLVLFLEEFFCLFVDLNLAKPREGHLTTNELPDFLLIQKGQFLVSAAGI